MEFLFYQDNPSDFSYFFDTSRRRTCYIAPERFVDSGFKNADSNNQSNVDLTATGVVKTGDLTPAMDIFSAGFVHVKLSLRCYTSVTCWNFTMDFCFESGTAHYQFKRD